MVLFKLYLGKKIQTRKKESTVPESELNPLTILTHESDQQNPSEFDIDQLVKEGGCARRDLPIPGLGRRKHKLSLKREQIITEHIVIKYKVKYSLENQYTCSIRICLNFHDKSDPTKKVKHVVTKVSKRKVQNVSRMK